MAITDRVPLYASRPLLAAAVVLGVLGSFFAVGLAAADERPSTEGRALLEHFCGDCHFGEGAEGGVDFEKMMASPKVDPFIGPWEKSFNMVRAALMPPASEEQPTPEQRRAMVAWIDGQLARLDCSVKRPGRVTLRRLNRDEYNRTIRDLVGIDFRPADDFPSDDVGYGFDNIGDVLTLPPMLLEKYLRAAEEIVARALEDPQARKKILICRPGPKLSKEACLRRILKHFASRAFRRPVTDEELERLVALARQVRQKGATDREALSITLQAVLVSPHFLFRVEKDPEPDDPDGIRALDDYEIASRLSYFLWSTMPDEQLFRLAAAGKLRRPDILRKEVRRMLADPRSEALVQNFAAQWLTLRRLERVQPDPARFPQFNDQLREDMLEETLAFFRYILRQDRSILDFLTADYTFVNERLAKLYGIDGVRGEEFRKVKLPSQRRGVVTHASILTVTSNPTRTSPVSRGKWLMETILGTPPPPPPGNAAPLAEGKEAELLGTLRERLEQHRADPECATCHKQMDVLGFGLENFNPIGVWREKDGRFPIDASGELPGGITFGGPGELMTVLAEARRDDFCRGFTKKMLTYALGRGVVPEDRCTLESIRRQLEQGDYRFSVLIEAIVTSDPFLYRAAKPSGRGMME